MTRNRDDFSALQALRTAFLASAAVAFVMMSLGSAISCHKEAALDRAAAVAAASLQFTVTTTDVADAGTGAKRG